MGKAQSRQVLTDVRSDCGHASTGPSGVRDQSSSRIRRAISLWPGKISSSIGSGGRTARDLPSSLSENSCHVEAASAEKEFVYREDGNTMLMATTINAEPQNTQRAL
jgi:hypothetical protein